MTDTASIEIIEPKLYAGAVADEIVASINDAVGERNRCSLVLSGGKTPGEVYRTLAKPPRVDEVPWQKLFLFLGDERYVPHDDSQSNYQTVRETLLVHVPTPGPKVYPFDTSLASPEQSAAQYEKKIRELEKLSATAAPQFDVVMLGVGEDGHTASIFPGSPLVNQSGALCKAVKSPDGQSRITLSPEALFGARKILILVRGENKSEIVKRVLRGEASEQDVPAMLFKRGGSRVTWFLDSAAAKDL